MVTTYRDDGDEDGVGAGEGTPEETPEEKAVEKTAVFFLCVTVFLCFVIF